MEKKIRSISISEHIDDKLIKDSETRGLTISANLTRILGNYFDNKTNEPGIMGTVIGPNGRIWYANATLDKVVKIEPSTIISGVEENILLVGNRVYPNPVESTLFFSNYANIVQIFDITGKLVIFENNNINSIDVNRLDKGIYLIEIDGVKTKFVKK